jgi:universal stress protein A
VTHGIRRILCPTDFSEFSARALRYAISLAKRYSSAIASLYVHPFDQPPSAKLPIYSVRAQMAPDIRKQILGDLQRFAEPVRKEGVVAEELLAEGDPVREILQLSEAMNADLLILGPTVAADSKGWCWGPSLRK